MYLCKDSGGKIVGLAIPKSKGIEFYPLPFGEPQFFGFIRLANGFFVLENIPREIGDAVMNLHDGIADAPSIVLRQRVRTMNLILGVGNLNDLRND